MSRSTARAATRGTALAAALALALTACGGGSGSGSPEDVDAAVEEGGTLTVWAWEPTLEQVAEDFEAANPGVTVELANVGTGNDQYTALQNAISAGSGVPDVAQVEYYALPQFALSESFADVSDLGAADLDGTFSPGPWASVQPQEDGIFGLPMDSGPMAMFYNADVFEAAGVEVPTTWDEYVEAARAIRAYDPDTYITNDTGDAGFTTSLIWQAGGQPFSAEGTDVTVDLADEGSQRFADLWQTMVGEDLVAPISSWSDEWFQALSGGQVASLVTGAWMPANLISGAPDAAGSWRVAPMPQWDEGASATAENGGSGLSVTEASEQKELAYAFLEYATTGEGAQTRVDQGAFPATVEQLGSEEFLSATSDYFGGQAVNEVLAQSSADVVDGFQYLPYQVYANSVFNDTVGQAYVGDGTIADGLAAWQQEIVSYGEEQGFGVTAR